MHHPKSDVDRLYVARKHGGRGLMQFETSYKIATIGLSTFLKSSDDPFLGLVQSTMPKRRFTLLRKRHKSFVGSLICLNYLEKQTNLPHVMQKEQSRKSDNKFKNIYLNCGKVRHSMENTPKE